MGGGSMTIEVRDGSLFLVEKGGRKGRVRSRRLPEWESFPRVFHMAVEKEGELRIGVKDAAQGRSWIRKWWLFLTVLKHTPRLAEVRERLERRRITARAVKGVEGWEIVLRNEAKKSAEFTDALKGMEKCF